MFGGASAAGGPATGWRAGHVKLASHLVVQQGALMSAGQNTGMTGQHEPMTQRVEEKLPGSTTYGAHQVCKRDFPPLLRSSRIYSCPNAPPV
jgi:hypothetical protein